MFGCGCWARHSGGLGVAAATSGCGEQLIATTLAQTVGEAILKDGNPAFHLQALMTDHFLNSDLLDDTAVRMGGVMVAFYDGDSVDLNMAFTTDSMIVGLMSTTQKKARVRVSRNSSNSKLAIEGFIVKL